MSIFILSIIIVLLSIFLYKRRYYFNTDFYYDYKTNPNVPHIKNGFPLAFLKSEELFKFARIAAQKLNYKSSRSSLFEMDNYNVQNAKDVEIILSSTKHLDKSYIYDMVHPFIKTGLLTSTGDKWFKRRRMLTPAFHFNILKQYFEIFKEESDRLVDTLREKSGKTIDINPVSTQFTLNSVCESAMGIKLSSLGDNGASYRNNIYQIGQALIYRAVKPWLFSDFVYSLLGYRKEFDKILKPIHEFTRAIIKSRKEEFLNKSNNKEQEKEDEGENIYMSKKKRYAMMDTLLQAQSEGLIDDEGIIEETDTFTFAGHDTTSAAMTFSLLLLAHHQNVQHKLFEEIQEFIGDEIEFTMDVFNKMPYMDRVLKECLRIYPPVPGIGRTLTEQFVHDGNTYEKGTNVNIFIYDIHRDPEYFPDPEKFDPDRFLPQECAKRHNFAYVPFSAGMRNCIGQKFAILELKIMLLKVIQNFTIHPVTRREELVFFVDLVLRTNHPIKMRFETRK